MKKIYNSQDYTEYLSKQIKVEKDKEGNIKSHILTETLKQALEIRKFEIDLYWKRTTYFWAFSAASFTGYFAILASDNIDSYKSITIAISIIGLLFSIGWYLVNRGSKYWQKNWEIHVSMLENEIIGPLFKTIYNPRKTKFSNFSGEYPFSVSKINQILSFIILLVWIFLLSYSVDYSLKFTLLDKYADIINTIYFIAVLLFGIYQLYKNAESGVSVDMKAEMKKEDSEPILLSRTK